MTRADRGRARRAPRRQRHLRGPRLFARATSRLLFTQPGKVARRHQAVPLPRPGPAARARRCRCGTRTSAWARSPTRPSATCSRWGRTTGCCDELGAARLGRAAALARHAAVRRGRSGVLYLLRTFGWQGPGIVVAALAYMFSAVRARLRGAHLGDAHAVGRAAVDDRRFTIRAHARRQGLALPGAVRRRRAAHRRRERDRAGLRRRRAPSCGSFCVWVTPRGRRGAGRSAPDCASACSRSLTSLWWISGLWAQGRYGLDILKYTETVKTVAAHVDAERGAARPRLLVLLRQRQVRQVRPDR